jgi:hypothetical protein
MEKTPHNATSDRREEGLQQPSTRARDPEPFEETLCHDRRRMQTIQDRLQRKQHVNTDRKSGRKQEDPEQVPARIPTRTGAQTSAEIQVAPRTKVHRRQELQSTQQILDKDKASRRKDLASRQPIIRVWDNNQGSFNITLRQGQLQTPERRVRQQAIVGDRRTDRRQPSPRSLAVRESLLSDGDLCPDLFDQRKNHRAQPQRDEVNSMIAEIQRIRGEGRVARPVVIIYENEETAKQHGMIQRNIEEAVDRYAGVEMLAKRYD